MHTGRMADVLAGRRPDRTPVWIMRQAGRYLPEYRKLRAKVGSFQKLYRQHAAEVTLMPLKRYGLDAAIIFSDILILPDALGMEVEFTEGLGPVLQKPVRGEKSLADLRSPHPQEAYQYLAEGIKETKAELAADTSLIGFVGSPWTLAVYGTQGSGSKNFAITRRMLYEQPKLLHSLLERLTREVIQLALLQIRAGADVIQIFDSWAGLLPRHLYADFSLTYTEQIVREIQDKAPNTPTILFARECALPVSELAKIGIAALSLDWKSDMGLSFAETKGSVVLQGNLDPAALYADDATLEKEVRRILDAKPANAGHIFNLGHGVPPDVSPDKIALLTDLVHRLGES